SEDVAARERQLSHFLRSDRFLLRRSRGLNQRRAFRNRDVLRYLSDIQRESLTNRLACAKFETLVGEGLEAGQLDLERIAADGKRGKRKFATLVGHDIACEIRSLVCDSGTRAGQHGSSRVANNAIHRCGYHLRFQRSCGE